MDDPIRELLATSDDEGVTGYILEDCPGCEQNHWFSTRKIDGQPGWLFDEDYFHPSFSPSLRMQGWVRIGEEDNPMTCHFYLTEGVIHFLDDCTHHLKGQKVKIDWRSIDSTGTRCRECDDPLDACCCCYACGDEYGNCSCDTPWIG